MAASLPTTLLPFPNFRKSNRKSAPSHVLHCSTRSGNHGDADEHQNYMKSTSTGNEEKHNDIWELFKEAQQNILFLNKQRLLAMEELERVKSDRDSLLDRVNQLESINLTNPKRDKHSFSSNLLLRIDSLVINGVIGSTEASDLRRLVMDSRISSDDSCEIISKNDAELLADLRHLSNKGTKNSFHVIHICTEMSPVVSVGSLASYVTGLTTALQRKGNFVEVILPRYGCLNFDEVKGLREVEAEFYSYFNGQLHGNKIWTGVVYGIPVTFIQPLYYSSLFSHERVYGCSNDFERFSYFSRASLDYLVKSGKRPDVLHIHNWHTSIVGPLFWDVFVTQGFEDTRILLTCQDFDSQCCEQPEKLALCGLDPARLNRPDRLRDDNNAHLVNILKGGIVYANKVITMSSVQPKGQIISASGHGLESTLATQREKLVIAPYGYDKSTWDPSTDNFIPQRYCLDDMNGKSVCKSTLQRHLYLPDEASKILVGCIFSNISNVELENLKTPVWLSSRRGVQFIVMGSSQSPSVKMALKILQEEVKDEDVRFIDEYDEKLSHLIISGSDIMLCLSLEDPLLQVPLKAMKYGAAPVPLNFIGSTFRNHGDRDLQSSKFSQYINSSFGNMSLSQAIDEINNNPSQWNRRIRDAMSKDFSWDSECLDVHVSTYAALKGL